MPDKVTNIVISPSQQDSNKTVVKHPTADTEAELTRIIGTALYNMINLDERLNVCLVPDYNLGDMQNLKEAIKYSNEFIKAHGGEGFHLDIHTDGGYKGSGATGFYKTQNGAAFGKPIFDAITKLTPWEDMSFVKRDNLACLNQTIATAYLQEISFHDKSEEAYWIFNNVNNIANALADGIYKGINLPRYVVPEYQYKAFMELTEIGVITAPMEWKGRLHHEIKVGEVMALLNKTRKITEKEN